METHNTVLEIRKKALQHNIQILRTIIAPSSKIMGMIKADGYGHSLVKMAKLLEQENIDCLGVAFADEGAILRTKKIKLPIVVMNIEKEGFENIIKHNLEPVFFNLSLLNDFIDLLKQKNIPSYPIHIEIETGLNRLGFEEKEWLSLIYFIKNKTHKKYFSIKSIFSHLSASDEEEHDNYTSQQSNLLDKFITLCNEYSIEKTYFVHIANSAGALRFQKLQKNIVRIGVSLLGIEITNPPVGLQRISTLKTTIAQIKQLKKGESIGYNRKSITEKETRIATIRIGYADGFSRQFSNGVGEVFLHGKHAPVVGNVCMDMTMVDISDIPEAKENDTVEIFGENITIETLAQKLHTIPYEIFTSIAHRIRKIIV
ncbi:MAG: alanine racemase [Chitinophagaceae bacterium]